ncbi:hypothetical protein DFS34DRAFT_654766 [Phlyctochytrium arcticum]|nr:hypothetical protein DFS34DRAFT_654766 [Phlyctochytrium arcticum]
MELEDFDDEDSNLVGVGEVAEVRIRAWLSACPNVEYLFLRCSYWEKAITYLELIAGARRNVDTSTSRLVQLSLRDFGFECDDVILRLVPANLLLQSLSLEGTPCELSTILSLLKTCQNLTELRLWDFPEISKKSWDKIQQAKPERVRVSDAYYSC